MTEGSGLLEKACRAVAALNLPACIKDSELRYLVVNAAYARLMGRPLRAFEGHTSLSLSADIRDAEREDRERRSLVFATDEMIACHASVSSLPYTLRCERFTDDDGSLFLFETVEDMPLGVLTGTADIGGASDLLFSSGLMDFIDAGIVVYDAENRLVYCNARFAEFYSGFGVELKPGIRLEALMEALYFSSGYRRVKEDDPAFEGWMREQLRDFSLPYLERVEQFADGRWVRMVNKRLENGMLVGLRIDVTEFKAHETLLSAQIRETWLLRAA
ncbi:MAG: PAS-domain containing protein, partial [Rhizobium pusense]|nr:PAS-domain containing protein [Agrobacterium pusense]